jgi:hypothetical protein
MATRIVLQGNSEVIVSEGSDEVAQSLADAVRSQGFANFRRDHKYDVLVNPVNVMYFEHVEVRAIRRELPDS